MVTRMINVGDSKNNSITGLNFDRVDDWKITLSGGDTYRFDLTQRFCDYGPLKDPYLELRFDGSVLVGDDNGGGGVNARIEYYVDRDMVSGSGEFQLRVYSHGSDKTGCYTLSAVEVDTSNLDDLWYGGQESLGNYNHNICIETVFFPGGRPDTVIDGRFNDNVNGLSGKDTLYGNVGDDTIRGGADSDSIDGGPGADSIFGDGGNDTIVGGNNLQLGGWSGPFTRIDNTNPVQPRFYKCYQWDPEKFFSDGDDTVNGGEGNDEIKLGSGNDYAAGSQGQDTIFGGSGNDQIRGDFGAGAGEGAGDKLYGERGNDNIRGGDGKDTIDGGDDKDVIFGEDGEDEVVGGGGNDYIAGGARNDTLNGQWDNDTVFGESGNDILIGEDGNDSLDGGAGNDYFLAGKGGDWITGGGGNDTITLDDVIHSSKTYGFDKIYGFDIPGPKAGDVIDLQFIDARPDIDGDQAFKLVPADQPQWGGVWVFDHSWDNSTMVQGWIGPTPYAPHGDWFQFWILDGPNVHARDYTAEDFVL